MQRALEYQIHDDLQDTNEKATTANNDDKDLKTRPHQKGSTDQNTSPSLGGMCQAH